LKEKAAALLEELADSAAFSGSVNTVVFEEKGRIVGHSTDGAGLHHALQETFGGAFEDRQVLILGCGGAGRAAALQAAREGASRVLLANRTRSRAEGVEKEIRHRLPGVEVKCLSAWPPEPADMQVADLVIHSTSLGMNAGDETGLMPDHFRDGQALLDMVYLQSVTPVMRIAREAGVHTVNGLGMLLHQGVESLRIWTGMEPPVEVMRQALEQAVSEREDAHGN
jgi:shikimate dehydrogenase